MSDVVTGASVDASGQELWDVLDRFGVPTGRTITRATDGSDPQAPLGDDEWHRVAQTCVFNREGKMLIQQRAASKVGWPNRWDLTAGGSVVAGESSQQAATRELREELGIDYDFSSSQPRLTLTEPHVFFDIYLADVDCDLEALVLQSGEVQAVQWAGLPQILGMIRTGTFCGFHPSLIELIFAIHDLPGRLALPPSDAAVSRLLPASKFDVSHIGELKTVDVDEVTPILRQLLAWIADMNWPVAHELQWVLPRFHAGLTPIIIDVLHPDQTDEIWKMWIISHLLGQWPDESLAKVIPSVRRIAQHPTPGEHLEEADQAAQELLDDLPAGLARQLSGAR